MIVIWIAMGLVLGIIMVIPAAYAVAGILAGVVFVVAHIGALIFYVALGVKFLLQSTASLIRLGLRLSNPA